MHFVQRRPACKFPNLPPLSQSDAQSSVRINVEFAMFVRDLVDDDDGSPSIPLDVPQAVACIDERYQRLTAIIHRGGATRLALDDVAQAFVELVGQDAESDTELAHLMRCMAAHRALPKVEEFISKVGGEELAEARHEAAEKVVPAS